ncbi:MAG: tryptophan--tRNA ligase, partial [Patescibacteria group bacterium]
LKTVEEVQQYLGTTISEACATLIMKADDRFIAVVRRGDCKLDNDAFKKVLSAKKLRLASPDEFTRLTGVMVGTARVYNPNLPTYLDSRLFEKEKLNGGTGSFISTFRYTTEDLKKIPNSRVVKITLQQTQIPRVLSGIRATGRLHLGNYLGAVKGMLELSNSGKYETLYMVADAHTLTTPYNVEELRKNRREVIIDYLAAGLDPNKSILFQQSEIPEHFELAFYFSSVTTIAKMQHLPTFKDKVKQYPDHATLALLNYPTLMAADILIYKASLVPVGIDQEPHIEAAREIARRMNQDYGTDFPEPKRFATKGGYVPSLTGEGKMSKSIEGSFINLTDSLEEIRKKVRGVPTATSAGGVMPEGVETLFTFLELLEPSAVLAFKKQFEDSSLRFVELKDTVTEAMYNELKPLQEKRKQLEADPAYVDRVIREGAEKAREIAQQTVLEVKEKMGLA